MKKFLKFVFLIPFSSIFLSGCMQKTIQQTIAVTTNISSEEELQERDYFGVSHQTHISNKCLNYSISETELNEMLSNGVKVVTIADQSWNRKIYYKGMSQNYKDEWGVWNSEGTCLGKKYVLEGKEKIINKYLGRLVSHQRQNFKNLNVQETKTDSRKDKPFIQNYKYDLSFQKDSKGRSINYLTPVSDTKFTLFIILGKNNKVDFIGSVYGYSEISPGDDGFSWKKKNGKYQIKNVDNFRENNQNVSTTFTAIYDYLAE